jgi:hypothetical protein
MRIGLIWLSLFAYSAFGGVVYFQNFESGSAGAEWTGAGSVQSTGGLSAFGFGQQHWRNDTTSATTLTLNGLASHSILNVTFDLAMWDSIDSGDQFRVIVDGTTYLSEPPFANYFGAGVCPNGCFEGPGTLLTAQVVDFGNPNYGYNSGFRDQGRHVTFQIAHTSSTAAISWIYPSSQGSTDESFGVDNVQIESDAVAQTGAPEPASFVLAGGALAAMAWRLRRR